MTTLAHYLATHRLTEEKFAAVIGMSRVSVSHWVNERSIPRRASMTAIFHATEGAVRPEDFRRVAALAETELAGAGRVLARGAHRLTLHHRLRLSAQLSRRRRPHVRWAGR